MALYGVVYAVLENDVPPPARLPHRQPGRLHGGGVGIGTDMAVNGAAAHAFAHILYKAPPVHGRRRGAPRDRAAQASRAGRALQDDALTVTLYMIGAFAISAFPLFSGFVSQVDGGRRGRRDHRMGVFLALTLASAGTFLHTGLKLPYYMFFGKDSGAASAPSRREHAGGDGHGGRRLRRHRRVPAAPVCAPALPSRVRRRTPPRTSRRRSGSWASRPSGFFLLLKQLDPRSEHQPRHRLVLPQGQPPCFVVFARRPRSGGVERRGG